MDAQEIRAPPTVNAHLVNSVIWITIVEEREIVKQSLMLVLKFMILSVDVMAKPTAMTVLLILNPCLLPLVASVRVLLAMETLSALPTLTALVASTAPSRDAVMELVLAHADQKLVPFNTNLSADATDELMAILVLLLLLVFLLPIGENAKIHPRVAVLQILNVVPINTVNVTTIVMERALALIFPRLALVSMLLFVAAMVLPTAMLVKRVRVECPSPLKVNAVSLS